MRRIPGAGSLWLRRVAKTVPPMRRVDQREARVQDYRISDPRVGQRLAAFYEAPSETNLVRRS